ncbi:MAG TPA: YggT family protein [Nitrospirales bacterium]|nr:YggT family protein [Nitrospirales bacterium]HIA13926.1 YggT family protein [Nitrospirales bacterium]HIB54097.1 YggT family protein [Nitrospirales bacterium]HIC05212.1 YggT family protein [Nitrospirales bacterium]HIN33410.1 YggT family protein [Nitrospirales bacterium]
MTVAENMTAIVLRLLDLALNVYMWVIIVRALISWVSPDPYNPIVKFLHRATEPVLAPIRRWLWGMVPAMRFGMDLSPLVVIMAIIFLQSLLMSFIQERGV